MAKKDNQVNKKSKAKIAKQKMVRQKEKVYDAVNEKIQANPILEAGKTQFTGFIDFVKGQGVAGLAVGLILGTFAWQ